MLVHALPHPLSRQRLRRSDERGVTLRDLGATGSAFHQACLCTESCNENQRFRKAERKTSLSGTVFLSPSLSHLRLEVRVLDIAVVLSPDYLLSEQSTEATYTQTVRPPSVHIPPPCTHPSVQTLRADSMADNYESVMNFGISAHYSPNVREGEFSELRHNGVLGSSHKASEDGIMTLW